LLLRCVSVEDAADYHALETDPEVKRFLPCGPSKLSVEEYKARISAGGLGLETPLAVIVQSTGAFAGRCGFTKNPTVEGWEIHILLAPSYWKQGYGTEIGSALLQDGFNVLGCSTIFGIVDLDNNASRRLCKKLGMTFKHSTKYSGRSQDVYSINRTPNTALDPAPLDPRPRSQSRIDANG
jgi:ribosomal-protein-alanine N-acetyltransferase